MVTYMLPLINIFSFSVRAWECLLDAPASFFPVEITWMEPENDENIPPPSLIAETPPRIETAIAYTALLYAYHLVENEEVFERSAAP
jgi:hypothetical protein